MTIERLFSVASLMPKAFSAAGAQPEDLLPGLSAQQQELVLGLWLQKLVEQGESAIPLGAALWSTHVRAAGTQTPLQQGFAEQWRLVGAGVLAGMRRAAGAGQA